MIQMYKTALQLRTPMAGILQSQFIYLQFLYAAFSSQKQLSSDDVKKSPSSASKGSAASTLQVAGPG